MDVGHKAAWPERLLSEKSGRCGIAADWRAWRFTYDYPHIRQVPDCWVGYLGFTAGRWLWSSAHKADSLIAKFKEAGGTVREIDVWAGVTAIISALVIRIIVCLSWAVNHYRDNAITYKAQRDKNARELKLANAAITDTDASCDAAALDAKYTKELADAAENDALRDMLPLVVVGCTSKQSVSQCVKPPRRLRRG